MILKEARTGCGSLLATPRGDHELLGMAVVGAGYWGPNLIRNTAASDQCDLRWVCDLDVDRAQRAVVRYSTIRVTPDLYDVLDDAGVGAVAIATPAQTHA